MIVAVGSPTTRSTLSRVPETGIPRRQRSRGESDGRSSSALCRPRRAQGHGGGLPAPHAQRQGRARGAHLRYHHPGVARARGVAGRGRMPARRLEATGVYWKPVWHILSDGDFELVLANARHVKNVPGRKSDVSDAVWLADLLAHGLIRASFVPDAQTQELRALLRTRKRLVRERTSHVQRIQKTLEDANIKLDSAISDLMGKSGRAMIAALIAGESDPGRLAALADGRLKAAPADLREALRGRVTQHHRFLLGLHLRQIDAIDAAIAEIDREVDASIGPFRRAVELLSSIPRVSALSARVIVAEIGLDTSRATTA